MEKCPWSGLRGPAEPISQLCRTDQLWAGETAVTVPTALLPWSGAAGDLSVLARSQCYTVVLHRALKGLQAPGATQALQTAGAGLQNNRLLPRPVDLNPVHACPCNSSSAQAKAPLPALPRCSSPFVRKGTPLNKRGPSPGTTRSQIAREALRADGACQGLTLRHGGDRARLGIN